ncbi:MAG TPA: VOC family protein [Thermoplasmata archaeon]|nr:VOC family protein [Thermoplasmata archaeon]
MEPPRLWIGAIVIDCNDFDGMVRFWGEALGYVPRDPPEDGSVVLMDPTGRGPNLALHRGAELPLEEYRLHLDLYSSAPEAETARLVRLGATVRSPLGPGTDFITLADPEGNLFDVIDKTSWSRGQFS